MIKKIIKDILIFRKAEPATKADLETAADLADTLRANRDICVGMAANMIGVNKRIIAFSVGPAVVTMLNPEIIKRYITRSRSSMRICHLRNAVRHIRVLLRR